MLFLTASANYKYHRNPRCVGSQTYEKHKIDNQTIHLVHGPQLWSQKQLEILEEIAENYPKCNIHLVIVNDENENKIRKVEEYEVAELDFEFKVGNIDPTTASEVDLNASTKDTSKLKRFKKYEKNAKKLQRFRRWMKKMNANSNKNLMKKTTSINILAPENLQNKLQNSTQQEAISITTTSSTIPVFRSLGEILRKNPQIFIEHLHYAESFMNSPLYNSWKHLSPSMRLFAIRVLYLWQYGGLSFSLSKEDYSKNQYTYETIENVTSTPKTGVIEIAFSSNENPENNLEKFISSGFSAFENMPSGVVTIDDAGLHMETKTSCHAFFGDLLTNLRKANENSTPSTVIKKTLQMFCRRNAVDSKYCSSIRG